MSLLKAYVPTEEEEQEAFFKIVRQYEAQYPELGLIHMIPNGVYLGADRARYGAKLKTLGLVPAVPDIFVPIPGIGEYEPNRYGLYIEMKRINASPSDTRPEQREFHERLRDQGYQVLVAKGWRVAWNALCAYLGMKGLEVE